MKQNEKILVYAVTGFLVVILMIAVVFGKEDDTRTGGLPKAGEIGAAPSLEDLLDRHKSGAPAEPSPGRGEPGKTEPGSGTGPAAPGDGNGASPPAVGDKPLVANVQLPPPPPASLVTEKLGLSHREHDYRIVRAQAGDTLSGLVQKWCGMTDGYLDAARACNEELTTLRVGQDVVLPWVDDEVLLQAIEARTAAAGKQAAAAPEAPGPAPAGAAALSGVPVPAPSAGAGSAVAAAAAKGASGTAREYTVKAGESLWRIGEREVGRSNVPAFLRALHELNPGLDAARLRAGQKILLPPKS